MKKMINFWLILGSSVLSATFPTGTFPRFVMFLSNFSFRLRMFRGRAWRFRGVGQSAK
jgi:hypothetical protein